MKNVTNVTIIGAGVQGSMQVYRNAAYGIKTFVFDNDPQSIQKLKAKVKQWYYICKDKPWQNAASLQDIYDNIIFVDDMEKAIISADLVIENVPENLQLKQKVWQTIDKYSHGKMLLTTNSSSLKSSSININVEHKNKTFNLNFSFPIRDDMVEVMWNSSTDNDTKETILAYLNRLGFIPIVTEIEIKGFSMNRIWRAIKKECLFLWGNGYNTAENIDRAFMLEWDTHIGPFGFMDMVGLDTVYNIEMSYFEESGDASDVPPRALKDMINAGKLGEKSGEGFYKWPNPPFYSENWLQGE